MYDDQDPAHLGRGDRIKLAGISGAGWRLAISADCARMTTAEKVAELHEITTDSRLYGFALGRAIHGRDALVADFSDSYQAVADLYAACGADTEVAERQLAWQRGR